MKKSLRIGIPLFLLLAAFAVYWPALMSGFVWDDHALILRDPFIRSWRLIPEGFHHFLFIDATPSQFFRPIQRLVYTFVYAVFDFDPRGYHLISILAHAAAGIALWKLAEEWRARFSPKTSSLLAIAVALVWTIHPVLSEAVTYVAGIADPLAAFFGFSALLLATRKRWPLAALAFFCAMLSKESGLLFIVIWLAFLIWQKAWRNDRRELILWACIAPILAAAYTVLRFTAISFPTPTPPPAPPLFTHLAMAARAFAEYAGLLIFPLGLHMERNVSPVSSEAAQQFIITIAGIILVIAFLLWFWRSRKRSPLAAFCLVACLISYLPISNLIPLNATMSEHWLYVPCAFLFLAIAFSLPSLTAISRISKRIFISLFAVWILFLGTRTWFRNFDWKNEQTFLESTIRDGGSSARMWIDIGVLMSGKHQIQRAIYCYKQALKIQPNQPFAIFGLGNAYLRAHDFVDAKIQYEKTAKVAAFRAQSLQALAAIEVLSEHRNPMKLMKESAQLEPENWNTQKHYIKYLDASGHTNQAIHHLLDFLDKQSFRASSWKLLGKLFVKANKPVEAHIAFVQAANYDVHDEEARKLAKKY